ncbi:hypothetical protein DL239_18065 [Sedimentitalea sp. CY04]|uniref:Uncharacterized protein n=1 Tax=Parasedimentitalea denitrificans TaxID=2211118 RepID=A0ABX0WDD3_9RHOB|nr:hypothetical protein [Sedimentitalea sp. CY04]
MLGGGVKRHWERLLMYWEWLLMSELFNGWASLFKKAEERQNQNLIVACLRMFRMTWAVGVGLKVPFRPLLSGVPKCGKNYAAKRNHFT